MTQQSERWKHGRVSWRHGGVSGDDTTGASAGDISSNQKKDRGLQYKWRQRQKLQVISSGIMSRGVKVSYWRGMEE